jgi:hypothetical protein
MYRTVTAVACVAVFSAMALHRTPGSGTAFTPEAFKAALAPAPQISSREWGSCQDDLDRTRRASSDASDAAESVKQKQDDFEECRSDPQTHNLLGNGCSGLRSDYESAVTNYESNMDDLDSRLRDVQSSCGYEFTINRMSPLEASNQRLNAARRRLCTSFKAFVPTVGLDGALKLCKAQMNGEDVWCKSCLSVP